MTGDGPRSYDLEGIVAEFENESTYPRVVGIILAGGTSSRFGEANKLLADFEGEPLVRHATRTLLRAELTDVIAVVGYEAEAVRTTLADMDLRVVRNPDYEEGLSTTVAAGIRAVEDADAVVFLPGDMPAVDPTTVTHVIDAYRSGCGTALAAAYDGQRGNPVLFDREYFDDLLAVEGDTGGRPVLVESDDSALVNVNDPGTVIDIDTHEDLRRQ